MSWDGQSSVTSSGIPDGGLSVLKRSVPQTLAFAFGLSLRSKTRRSKTRVLGRRLRNGKPQERLRFRDLRFKTLAFKKRIAIISCILEAALGARACVQVLCVQKMRRFAFAFLSPLSAGPKKPKSSTTKTTIWHCSILFRPDWFSLILSFWGLCCFLCGTLPTLKDFYDLSFSSISAHESGAWGPPQLLKKMLRERMGKSESSMWVLINSGNRSESCSEICGFRITQVMRRHSENKISHSENFFRTLRAAPRIHRNAPRAPRKAFSLQERFS